MTLGSICADNVQLAPPELPALCAGAPEGGSHGAGGLPQLLGQVSGGRGGGGGGEGVRAGVSGPRRSRGAGEGGEDC
jgi:hypothetical protein